MASDYSVSMNCAASPEEQLNQAESTVSVVAVARMEGTWEARDSACSIGPSPLIPNEAPPTYSISCNPEDLI